VKSSIFKVERKNGKKAQNVLAPLWFLIPALLMVGIFIYYPVFATANLSFKNYKLYDQSNIFYNGLENFRGIFTDLAFKRIIQNSIIWVTVSLFFQFTIGFGLALYLRTKFRFSGIYQGIIFIPWALSGFLMGLVWKWMFDDNLGVLNDMMLKLGLIETPIPWLSNANWAMAAVIIANIWYGVTFFVIMILAALQGVPKEILEAADLDGARPAQDAGVACVPGAGAGVPGWLHAAAADAGRDQAHGVGRAGEEHLQPHSRCEPVSGAGADGRHDDERGGAHEVGGALHHAQWAAVL
jgi:multiple sugar transport system permease protein